MIDPRLLEILCCPVTHQELREADDPILARVRSLHARGLLRNAAGQTVDPPEGGLVRADDRILYPIRDAIPVLLVDEGIPLADLEECSPI